MSILETIAKRVKEKPVPSMVAFQLLKVIEDEEHSLKDIVKIVQNDAALTTEVLKVANSATFFRGQPVTTINRAVLVMGEIMVVGIAICAASSSLYSNPLEGYESASGEMWDHSLRSAIGAREIALFNSQNIASGLAFTAGLLHDIGKLVLSEFLKDYTKNLTFLCDSGKVEDYLEAERKTIGTDHAQVGYAMALEWGLPESLCMVIKDHHHPSETKEEYRKLVYAVHLGSTISMMSGPGTGSDNLAYQMDSGFKEYFHIRKIDFEKIILKVQEDFTSTKESIML